MATGHKHNRLYWGLAGLVVVLAALGAWWLTRPAAGEPNPAPLLLLVSGDTRGWIVPCGCTANQSGGLPRRGTHVRRLQERGEVIVADAGGAPGGTSPYQRARFEAILRGEMIMGLAAHNLGGPEAALGAKYLRQIGAHLRVPFLSANLRDRQGALVAEPLRIIERGGRRIGLTGVLSPRFQAAGLKVDDPREAVLQVIASAKGRYHALVVLAYLPEEELRDLAANLPEADAVVGGPTGQSLPPRRLGPTLLASATNKGKFLIELEAAGGPANTTWTGKVFETAPQLPDDPAQAENLRRHLKELGRKDFAAAETGLMPPLPADLPADYRLAGNHACLNCHAGDCRKWEKSHHAQAWPTLSRRGYHVNSFCQQCHTNGFGLPGGFISAQRSARALGVGCESCHGPALAHSRDPKIKTTFRSRDQCVRCHDHENSPKFVYGSYWEQIRHGTSGK